MPGLPDNGISVEIVAKVPGVHVASVALVAYGLPHAVLHVVAVVNVRVWVSRSIAQQRCYSLGAHKEAVRPGSIGKPFQVWPSSPLQEAEHLLGVDLDDQASHMSEREQLAVARENAVASDIVRYVADAREAIQKVNPATVEQISGLGVVVCSVRSREVAHGFDPDCQPLQFRECPGQGTPQRLVCVLENLRIHCHVLVDIVLPHLEDYVAEAIEQVCRGGLVGAVHDDRGPS